MGGLRRLRWGFMGFWSKFSAGMLACFFWQEAFAEETKIIREPNVCFFGFHMNEITKGCHDFNAIGLAFNDGRVVFAPKTNTIIASDIDLLSDGYDVLISEYPQVAACVSDAKCRNNLPEDVKPFFEQKMLRYWRARRWYDAGSETIGVSAASLVPLVALIEDENNTFLFLLPGTGLLPLYEYIVIQK